MTNWSRAVVSVIIPAVSAVLVAAAAVEWQAPAVEQGHSRRDYPFRNPQLGIEQRIDNILSLLTLEKIAQRDLARDPRWGRTERILLRRSLSHRNHGGRLR